MWSCQCIAGVFTFAYLLVHRVGSGGELQMGCNGLWVICMFLTSPCRALAMRPFFGFLYWISFNDRISA